MKNKKEDIRPVVIRKDKSLDKYLEKEVFKDKIERANHVLKTVGLPKKAAVK